jgi:Short repeat of unknown function (DUF308)
VRAEPDAQGARQREKHEENSWNPTVTLAVIGLIAGIVVVSTPVSSLTVLAVLPGIWFIVMGLAEIIGGAAGRRRPGGRRAPGRRHRHRRPPPGGRVAESARRRELRNPRTRSCSSPLPRDNSKKRRGRTPADADLAARRARPNAEAR